MGYTSSNFPLLNRTPDRLELKPVLMICQGNYVQAGILSILFKELNFDGRITSGVWHQFRGASNFSSIMYPVQGLISEP